MTSWGYLVVLFLSTLYSVDSQSGCLNDQITLGNIRYSYHENDCNQYRQCHVRPTGNQYVIVYRACPHGYYWDQAALECRPNQLVNCPIATCGGSTPVEGSGCRAHWECVNRIINATCCDPGQRFTQSHGCVADYTCTDPCPGPCGTDHVCRSFPDWDRPNFYYKNEVDTTYERECPGGTHFDVLECGCVKALEVCTPAFSVDFGSGSSILAARGNWLADQNLVVDRLQARFGSGSVFRGNVRLDPATVENPYLIRFSFRESGAISQNRNLLVSDDCQQCHQLSIDLLPQSFGNAFQVTLKKSDRIVSQITLNLQGFPADTWRRVAVYYSGKELLAIIRSENITYMKRTGAPPLNILNCGFQFGTDTTRPFRGFLKSLSISTCNNRGRSLDVVPEPVNAPIFPWTLET